MNAKTHSLQEKRKSKLRDVFKKFLGTGEQQYIGGLNDIFQCLLITFGIYHILTYGGAMWSRQIMAAFP